MTAKRQPVSKFISEPITVHYSTPPAQSKKPTCPDLFSWNNEAFTIHSCLAEWTDFSRRGRMARNLQPQHKQIASKRGSWGVGRFYFDVRVQNKRCFRLYYDRTPSNATEGAGIWILLAELVPEKD